MNKKVLILSASPRKHGNSDILCDQLSRGAEDAGHEVEKIFLRDKKINYCVACDGCRSNQGNCIQKDDMAGVLQKMIDADVIVLATPIYFYTMDAQLKTVIDRTYPRYTEIKDKDFYIIVTAADDNPQAAERTIEGIRGFTSCLHGATEKGIIYGMSAWHKGEIETTPAMRQALEMGKAI